jgi:hypothetical protein
VHENSPWTCILREAIKACKRSQLALISELAAGLTREILGVRAEHSYSVLLATNMTLDIFPARDDSVLTQSRWRVSAGGVHLIWPAEKWRAKVHAKLRAAISHAAASVSVRACSHTR